MGCCSIQRNHTEIVHFSLHQTIILAKKRFIRYAEKLRLKKEAFKMQSGTKKHLFLTFITTYGVLANGQSIGLVDHDLKMDVLF